MPSEIGLGDGLEYLGWLLIGVVTLFGILAWFDHDD